MEEVGPHRLAACAVGFVGTLLVVQPNFVDVGWPALWPLLVAVVFAMFMLVTRQVAKEVDPLVLQANSGLIATAILLPIVVFSTGLEPLEWGIPATSLAWLLLPLGLFGTLAHLLMTWSLRFAPSATLAPVQYLEIPIATVIGACDIWRSAEWVGGRWDRDHNLRWSLYTYARAGHCAGRSPKRANQFGQGCAWDNHNQMRIVYGDFDRALILRLTSRYGGWGPRSTPSSGHFSPVDVADVFCSGKTENTEPAGKSNAMRGGHRAMTLSSPTTTQSCSWAVINAVKTARTVINPFAREPAR